MSILVGMRNQYVNHTEYKGYFLGNEIVVSDHIGLHFLETC